MPVNPNFLERLVLLRLNKGPAPMLDLFGAAGFKSVTLALDMDLFETLADVDDPLTAEALPTVSTPIPMGSPRCVTSW
jgi:hypothetical protein